MITERALNRALLARQGLLEPISAPPDHVVGAIGAVQTQYWPSLAAALGTRTADLALDEVYRALADRRLLTGTLLRGTIHTVTPAEYPAYAQVTAASKVSAWRYPGQLDESVTTALRHEMLRYAAQPRTAEELVEFLESWVAAHPGVFGDAELAYQRASKWRPGCAAMGLLRVPGNGAWGPRTPNRYLAAPDPARPPVEQALDTVVRAHLRAFGPAAAEDVAAWIGWNVTPVRHALRRRDDLVRFTDEAGRTLYDLPDAPRPAPDTPAPVRLLPWFDSTLLAYAPKRRTRILPEPYRDVVYVKRNGQLKPTFLVAGMVAGMWSITVARRTATLTLTPLGRVGAEDRKALLAEAERLVRFCQPDATHHEVRYSAA